MQSDTIAVTAVSSIKSNDIGFGNKVRVVLIIEIGIDFNVEVGADNDFGDAEVDLGIALVMTICPILSQLSVAASISPISRDSLTPVSSIAQLGQAIKPLVLFS